MTVEVETILSPEGAELEGKIDAVYVGYVRRRLRESGLTPEEQGEILSEMMVALEHGDGI